MFGLIVTISDRMAKGNFGLMPSEVYRLMEISAIDIAEIAVKLSQLECSEIVDECGADVYALHNAITNSKCENEKIYYSMRALTLANPILDTPRWRDFLEVLKK